MTEKQWQAGIECLCRCGMADPLETLDGIDGAERIRSRRMSGGIVTIVADATAG